MGPQNDLGGFARALADFMEGLHPFLEVVPLPVLAEFESYTEKSRRPQLFEGVDEGGHLIGADPVIGGDHGGLM